MLNFHAAPLASPASDFLRYQHYLVMRPAAPSYTNSTNVFPYPLPDPTVEDAAMLSIQSSAAPSIAQSRFLLRRGFQQLHSGS